MVTNKEKPNPKPKQPTKPKKLKKNGGSPLPSPLVTKQAAKFRSELGPRQSARPLAIQSQRPSAQPSASQSQRPSPRPHPGSVRKRIVENVSSLFPLRYKPFTYEHTPSEDDFNYMQKIIEAIKILLYTLHSYRDNQKVHDFVYINFLNNRLDALIKIQAEYKKIKKMESKSTLYQVKLLKRLEDEVKSLLENRFFLDKPYFKYIKPDELQEKLKKNLSVILEYQYFLIGNRREEALQQYIRVFDPESVSKNQMEPVEETFTSI